MMSGANTVNSLHSIRHHKESNSSPKFYHLVKPNGENGIGSNEKMVTEIYLTR